MDDRAVEAPTGHGAAPADRARVTELIGREPRGSFDVVVRTRTGDPVVVRNAPLLDDGTPMPTRHYLVGTELVKAVSRLEADGGVRRAEAEIPADVVAALHDRAAAERDAALPDDHTGPRPSGGVGGTRTGVKCLHAHVARELATGDDEVGRWALDRLDRPVDAVRVPIADDEPGQVDEPGGVDAPGQIDEPGGVDDEPSGVDEEPSGVVA